jgi:hypothetical protein
LHDPVSEDDGEVRNVAPEPRSVQLRLDNKVCDDHGQIHLGARLRTVDGDDRAGAAKDVRDPVGRLSTSANRNPIDDRCRRFLERGGQCCKQAVQGEIVEAGATGDHSEARSADPGDEGRNDPLGRFGDRPEHEHWTIGAELQAVRIAPEKGKAGIQFEHHR